MNEDGQDAVLVSDVSLGDKLHWRSSDAATDVESFYSIQGYETASLHSSLDDTDESSDEWRNVSDTPRNLSLAIIHLSDSVGFKEMTRRLSGSNNDTENEGRSCLGCKSVVSSCCIYCSGCWQQKKQRMSERPRQKRKVLCDLPGDSYKKTRLAAADPEPRLPNSSPSVTHLIESTA